MRNRKTLLKDTFEFKTVPFLVEVEEREMFYHKDTGEIRTPNIKGHPRGMGRTPAGWRVCKARVARVRPDYPYRIEKEWPENVSKHFKDYELLEVPKKRSSFLGQLLHGDTREDREPERDAKEIAEGAIGKLKTAYEERDKVETLD